MLTTDHTDPHGLSQNGATSFAGDVTHAFTVVNSPPPKKGAAGIADDGAYALTYQVMSLSWLELPPMEVPPTVCWVVVSL
ncbi:hypothetical protein AGMMS49928_10510 [Spirochaetia bacterium]|nr:hypothetical protein AGMMS49928_10510 [Spirochaetia bacterium]